MKVRDVSAFVQAFEAKIGLFTFDIEFIQPETRSTVEIKSARSVVRASAACPPARRQLGADPTKKNCFFAFEMTLEPIPFHDGNEMGLAENGMAAA